MFNKKHVLSALISVAWAVMILFLPLWLWTLVLGGLIVATAVAYSKELESLWHRFKFRFFPEKSTTYQRPKKAFVRYQEELESNFTDRQLDKMDALALKRAKKKRKKRSSKSK